LQVGLNEIETSTSKTVSLQFDKQITMIYHIKSSRETQEKSNSGHCAVQDADNLHLKLTQNTLGTPCWNKAMLWSA